MHLELTACDFGSKPASKESQDARSARIMQQQQTGVDARSLRVRRRLLAKGREASSLFGAGEGVSLGAGL